MVMHFRVFAQVVNADDVLMGHLAGKHEFLHEAPLHLACHARIAGRFRANHLQRDRHTQLGIPRVIHGAHTAHPEKADDTVTAAERLTYLEGASVALGIRKSRSRRFVRIGDGTGELGCIGAGLRDVGITQRCDTFVGETRKSCGVWRKRLDGGRSQRTGRHRHRTAARGTLVAMRHTRTAMRTAGHLA